MKIICILLFLQLWLLPIFKSQNVSGIVLNSSTKEEIPYVAVGIKGTSFGTLSNEKGVFSLDGKFKEMDTLVFSGMGFQTEFIIYHQSTSNKLDTVFLKEQNIVLPNIVVYAPLTNSSEIGFSKTGASRSVNFALSNGINKNVGSQIGKYFKFDKATELQKFSFYLNENNFDTVKFRVNVFDIESNIPSNFLHSEEILLELVNAKAGWIQVDLSKYKIRVDKPIALCLEWIYGGKKGNKLTLPISLPVFGSKHFYKYGSQNNWKVFGNMSTPMLLTVLQ